MSTDDLVSRTEPSTPISSSKIERPGLSGPFSTIRDGHGVRLPPYELPQVTARLSKEVSRPLSRSRTKVTTGSTRNTPRSTPRATPHGTPRGTPRGTPTRINRRASEVIEQRNKRRRRSSMLLTESGEAVYDPTYVGPITIDYLRFWCKVLIKDKEKEKEILRTNKLQSPPPPIQPLLVSPSARDFDQSLPLPSESAGLLQSPFQLEGNYAKIHTESPLFEEYKVLPIRKSRSQEEHKISGETLPSIPEALKPKTFSYLEKILMTRKMKNQSPSKARTGRTAKRTPLQEIEITSRRSSVSYRRDENAEVHHNENDFLVIQDKSEISKEKELSPKYEGHQESQELPNWASIHSESGENNDTPQYEIPDFNEAPITNPTINEQEEQTNIDELKAGSLTPERHHQLGISLSSLEFSPSKVITPQNGTSPFQRTNSSNQIIQEEYTFGDGNLSHTFIELPSTNSEDSLILPLPEIKIPAVGLNSNIPQDIQVPNSRIVSSDLNRLSTKSMPATSVRSLVKSIRYHSIASIADSTEKRPKRITSLSQEVYQSLQEKSDQFLDSLMSDLHAYAEHRTSTDSPRINLSDVLLYLNRVNFVGSKENREVEVRKISSLAQNYLPLELLISLDNNLNAGKMRVEHFVSQDLDASDSDNFIESEDSDVYTD
ncbi:uncharacterized protein CANTADRAFT_23655 [Suhomyces tanzawaensis NRRL Y-17324]|uniref:CENP-T/Histone H4 histone fold domain-containing protein n=1 Tax=Suhomyces tanzawaensis NRRL Y-17324 TaxID=984487 RepID=A0A1E4SDE8_9ASCO|nr:uncharacterized protein CANTADRAFT_23655 [Suhomyces tanzawaensis NRRL Y-17324]ODV77539.1 hypothetical protein CANTADRAFT_23655 [Suhomyces tanzawaensis NRRL Y-17324]